MFPAMMHRTVLAMLALAPAILPAATMTLRDAADRALKKNLGLAVTRGETAKADDAIEIARAAFDEVVSLNSGVARSRSAGADYAPRGPESDSWTNSAGVSKRFSTGASVKLDTTFFAPTWGESRPVSPDYDTAAGISVSQPLLRGRGEAVNLAPLARARIHLERSRQNLRIAAADLLASTAAAYRNLAAAHDLLALRESSLKAAESLLAEVRVRRRPEIGAATEQDELQAASDVAARRVEIADARRALARAADTLRDLLGEDPGEALDTDSPLVAPLPALPPALPKFADFMTAVDAFNPETELRELDIRDAQTSLDAALADNAPSLDLVAGARTLGRDDSPFGAIEGMNRDNGRELSAGLRLTLPLGMRESEATLRLARRTREQARLRLADTRRKLGYAARAVWRDIASARERLTAAETALALRTRAYDNERARLARGVASLNDVLQSAARLDSAKLDRLSAALDCATADIRGARLDGDILSRLGYKWTEIDETAGADPAPTAGVRL